ncbi:DMT family transporter [Methylomagnum ishizawai]|uniref:DMT family transporter n=1 Tax=Methylomagnum ishizawai TaxID=1760988 RepID=UPI001FE95C96|nr:DMT family transporter [Methylomagnum ishizawai]
MSRPKKRKSRRRASVPPPPAVPRRDGPARGLAYMLAAGLLFAVMGVVVYAAALAEPPVAASMVSFVRVALNLSILLVPAVLARRVAGLFGDLRPSLWWRGVFGGVSLILSFAAIQRIGPGESAFLSASSGVFVAALGPYVLGQRNSWGVWLAIWGAWLGLFLLFQPGMGQGDWQGRALGLASGFLAALAYLMVARAGRSNPPGTVVFYFCLVATLIHLAWFAVEGVALPSGFQAWGWAVLAGLAGSAAQWFMTRAYQLAPAALVGAVGYVGPVLSVALGAWLFGKVPGNEALAGCGLVLLCGVYCGGTTFKRRAGKHS